MFRFLLVGLLFSEGLKAELPSPDLGMIKPKGPQTPSVEYKLLYYPASEVLSQGVDLKQISQDLIVRIPVSETEQETWMLRASVHNTQITSEATVNQVALPSQLWSIAFGNSYQYKFEERKSLGGDLSIGSSSDYPFSSYKEFALAATITLTLPQGEKDSWLLLLNYSNVRVLLNHIPIPGIAYSYNPSEEFRAMLGLPFLALYWKPTFSWTAMAMISPFSANAQLSYALWGPLQIYTLGSWSTQTFILVERKDPDERFFHSQKSLIFGLRAPLSRNLLLDVSSGYYFSREYYLGRSYRDTTGTSVTPESGFQLGSQVRIGF